MQILPTREAILLAWTGAFGVIVGVASSEPAVIAWSGGFLLALALARGLAGGQLARLRRAGFEMIWKAPYGGVSVIQIPRGGEIELAAEIWNRSGSIARIQRLVVIASGLLTVHLEPEDGTIAEGGSLSLSIRVRGSRVGHHMLHGLSLELSSGVGLFRVPLSFAHPRGISVVPAPLRDLAVNASGGRARFHAELRGVGKTRGHGSELLELREHVPGDPFKHIAWKASAKRGKLLIREWERDDREVVMIVLNNSVELLAGAPGDAPLDRSIDLVARLARHHIVSGDHVGLAIVSQMSGMSGSEQGWIAPATGTSQSSRFADALTFCTDCHDSERSDWDEGDVAIRVLEHLATLDAQAGGLFRADDIPAIATRAQSAMARAPFALPLPAAPTEREQRLRHYLRGFGIQAPPRPEGEPASAYLQIARTLERIAQQRRPRATRVYVCSPAPETAHEELRAARLRLRSRGVALHWYAIPPHVSAESAPSPAPNRAVTDSAAEAVEVGTPLAPRTGRRREIVENIAARTSIEAYKRGCANLRSLGITHAPLPSRRRRSAPCS